jgi:hypothetical protein
LLEEREDFSVGDHRESILTAATEQFPEVEFQRKCQCDIY